MAKQPSRDPGAALKRQLRAEVNFGCPVRFPNGSGCGSPILTFHHFDPPWEPAHVHNPDGMIALCRQHHDEADGRQWSNEQLRAMKRTPYVDDAIKVQWPWRAETLVMKVGPSLVVESGSPMRLNGQPVMHFKPVEIPRLGVRTAQFDSEILDAAGNPWLSIKESFFDLRLAATTDLVFVPLTKMFRATHRDGTFLAMQFQKMPVERFRSWLPSFMTNPEIAVNAADSVIKGGAVDSNGEIAVVIFNGWLRSQQVDVRIRGNRMSFRCLVPGLQEEFDWHSWVVNSVNRAVLALGKGPEFFSLG